MTYSHHRNRKFFLCMLVGAQLMCFALFLHPMNPEDFLWLAMTDPVQTISSQYGMSMAIVFWLGLALIMIAVIGLSDVVRRLANLRSGDNRSGSNFWQAR